MVAIMHVARIKTKYKHKVYEQIYLRETYRQPGQARSQVQHRTLLNLTHYPPAEIDALEQALNHKAKGNAWPPPAARPVAYTQGVSVGAVWLLLQVMRTLGLDELLGASREGRLVQWLIMARLIGQGSQLSATRLGQTHAVSALLQVADFDEDDLYAALDWADKHQTRLEDRLFRREQARGAAPTLYLYDVTSTYLEGTQNAYGAYGYNRDGKKGKLQIVLGLLTDGAGQPLSIEMFQGNTQDPQTVLPQLRKLAARFGARHVTVVGDRGMLKSAQIEALQTHAFHYVTAITKPQIEALLQKGAFPLELFDEHLCEVALAGVRYLLRRNPLRAQEIVAQRQDKYAHLAQRVTQANAYLAEHPRAQVAVALRHLQTYAAQRGLDVWVQFAAHDRTIDLQPQAEQRAQRARLDGCYVLKSDVPPACASATQLHDRYKDLAQVEQAFRTLKTGHLELRPVYVRTAAHTRAHVFIAMLAYRIRRVLAEAWQSFDLTVQEGLRELSSLCALEVAVGAQAPCLVVPQPRDSVRVLFEACNVPLPNALPRAMGTVATKTKLHTRRKKHITS